MIAKMLADFTNQGMEVNFNEYFNAYFTLHSGVDISIGFGPSHYGNNSRVSDLSVPQALLRAKFVEVAIIRDGRIIGKVKGWQSARQIRALVRRLSA
jgi:hypothetical protein